MDAPIPPMASDSLSEASNSGGRTQVALLSLAFASALLLLTLFFGDSQTRFDELAGGVGAVVRKAPYKGNPIHFSGANLASSFTAFPEMAQPALWLIGASQLHTLSPYQEGDRPVSWYLHHRLIQKNLRLYTLSEPNLNLQEALTLTLFLLEHHNVRGLILPMVLDDMRHTGIRQSLRPLLADPKIQENLKISELGTTLLLQNRIPADPGTVQNRDENGVDLLQTGSPPNISPISGSGSLKSPSPFVLVRDRTEKLLNQALETHSNLWRLRSQGRGRTFIYLYWLRALAQGSLPQDIPLAENLLMPMPESAFPPGTYREFHEEAYKQNLMALQTLAQITRLKNIPLLLYLQPRTQGSYYPYANGRIARFRHELDSLAASKTVTLVDMENALPDSDYGQLIFNGILFPDIFHINHSGHQHLAERLDSTIQDWMGPPE